MTFAVLCCFVLLFSACAGKSEREELSFITAGTIPKLSNFEVADRFLRNLKSDHADTILFYKRTCVGSNDFYLVFWSKDGTRKAAYFSDHLADMVEQKDEQAMKANSVLDFLGENFSDLKTSTIKPNRRTHQDGNWSEVWSSHYCYSDVRVYTEHDSIISGSMKDRDFDKYVDINVDPNMVNSSLETNENYEENIHSKWFVLLRNIERKISESSEIEEEEIKGMMTSTK